MEEKTIRDTITIKCQQCGEEYQFNVYNVINLQKDKDLYEPLFSLDIFKHQCEKCGYSFNAWGYSDANYYDNVLPNAICPECGLNSHGENEEQLIKRVGRTYMI